ncbi:MAG: alanine--tRNA ligase, partial [Eubacterium sp.]|nr:alanine--tRNA ligase [Eubacterium sp.]
FYRDPETGECDNFWEHGAGPCGPCSEIYYDRGEKYGCGEDTCGVGCDCDRYMEVWNDVFTQFENDGKGNYTELSQKNIDTGMGLERLAVVVQDVDTVFDIDTMRALRDHVCEMAHTEYESDEKKDVSIRLISDHIRSATFMISDGILPSNEGRGYVLRRLIRRIARHGRLLGIEGSFVSKLSGTVIRDSKDAYPELQEKSELIFKVLDQEEAQFNKTIDQGLNILSGLVEDLKKNGSKVLSGDDAFKLYDTYGFPLDLTMEILEDEGISVDEEGFDAAMKKQRDTARAARKTTNYMGAEATVYEELDPALTSVFVGYDRLENESSIIALTTEDEVASALTDGQNGTIIVDETCFYGTMGGQVGDHGVIEGKDGASFRVEDTIHLKGGKIGHVGVVTSGMFAMGDKVTLKVEESRRRDTCKNHSATHLLQEALREVLGTHVEQSGSYVDNDRLRFDFTHFSAMTPDEIAKVEALVNEKIEENLEVVTREMGIEDAKKEGAMALFGEKYGDVVRVVKMGDFSVELCGGTHVSNTGVIRSFKIVSESGISAGVRRIEAITGQGVTEYYVNLENMLNEAASVVKSTPAELVNRLNHLMKEMKDLQSENASLKAKAANEALGDVSGDTEEVGGVKFVAKALEGVDMNGLRDLGDKLKNELGEGVIVLASANDGKVNLMAMATDSAVKAGVHAGNLIKEIAPLVGGGGGGRPNMAQAGGKNPAGVNEALAKAKETLASQLG